MDHLQNIKDVLFQQGAPSVSGAEQRVLAALANTSTEPTKFVTFMNNYTKWNGQFAGGVASLTSLISQNPHYFKEPGFPSDLADRATFVASFIFDAARDEYNDSAQAHRDPHRILAQATLMGMQAFYDLPDTVFEQGTQTWLRFLSHNVIDGYVGGMTTPNDIYAVFRGLGYHLGSELLADREFSIIDNHFRTMHPELFEFMKRKTIKIADMTHRAYAWIGIHSGLGGGVETDHYDFGLQGGAVALKYLHDADYSACVNGIYEGFKRFDEDHKYFFEAAQVPSWIE